MDLSSARCRHPERDPYAVSVTDILDAIREWPPAITYLVLFFGSLIEYIIPPVPGDTIVVAGAVLVGAFGWSIWPVFLIVTLGAVIGAAADFYIGRWLVRSGRLQRMGKGTRAAIDDLVARFRRHGAWYLAVNRFLPGVRAFFFVAAGLAELRIGVVLWWSALSAMAWNALLIFGGVTLGQNIETLEAWVGRYQAVMWGVVGLVLLLVGIKVYRTVARARQEDAEAAD